MTTFGLTASGFKRKRLDDIKVDIEIALKGLWGDNIDLTPQSNFGQFVGIISEMVAEAWERDEDIYNSQYPATASDSSLSNVVMYNGIDRQDATQSTVTLSLTGSAGTVIPKGSIVSVAATSEQFITDIEVVISGATDVGATAKKSGAIQALAGTINQIDTPIFGWETVINTFDANVGRNMESDSDLRARRELSTQALGQNLVDSLFGQLLNIDGVEDALVIDNKTGTTVDGIPGHQFLSVVLGGGNTNIASAIWENTPQAINSHGAITETIIDAQGFPQDVKFSRPADINIYFSVTVTTSVDFPASGETDIKSAIADYGASNFKISHDVILSEFYTAINSVHGITSIDLRIGLSASPTGTSNLPIAIEEISRYDTTRVEVTIV